MTVAALFLANSATAVPPPEVIPYEGFRPLPAYAPSPESGAWIPEPIVDSEALGSGPQRPTSVPLRTVPTPRVGVVEILGPGTSHSLTGKASWYCSVEKPICHYKYPPGSMVAAACSKLRAAMGPNWRGQAVRVTRLGTERFVDVTLVDYCASTDKTIDLYWAPMHKLGGTGVLTVVVGW